MKKKNLKHQIKILKKENRRLDKTIFELSESLGRVQNLIIDIVEENKKDISKDLDYISLKFFVETDEYYNMKALPFKIEREYRKTGNYPTLEEYHNLLIHTLKIPQDFIEEFTIDITIHEVKKQVQKGDFMVFNKILEDYSNKSSENFN